MRVVFPAAVLLSMYALLAPTGGGHIPVSDKVIHMSIFGTLALTGRLAGVPVKTLVAGLVAYAIGSEILQGIMPFDRTADWHDCVADLAGSAIGLLIASFAPPARRA